MHILIIKIYHLCYESFSIFIYSFLSKELVTFPITSFPAQFVSFMQNQYSFLTGNLSSFYTVSTSFKPYQSHTSRTAITRLQDANIFFGKISLHIFIQHMCVSNAVFKE